MGIDIIIIFIFVISACSGWKRGLFVQLMIFVTTILSVLIAVVGYQWLAEILRNFLSVTIQPDDSLQVLDNIILSKIEAPIFASISFMLIYAVLRFIFRVLTIFLHPFRKLLSFGKFGKILSVLLALVICYFNLQLTLTVLSLFPVSILQNSLASSALSRIIIMHSPVSSHFLLQLFIEKLIHIPAY